MIATGKEVMLLVQRDRLTLSKRSSADVNAPGKLSLLLEKGHRHPINCIHKFNLKCNVDG